MYQSGGEYQTFHTIIPWHSRLSSITRVNSGQQCRSENWIKLVSEPAKYQAATLKKLLEGPVRTGLAKISRNLVEERVMVWWNHTGNFAHKTSLSQKNTTPP
ncbi:hypothetical protein ILYODFUR_009453 [Ilyodon furcidens]|uniref:Uncharacterized protein n=1 Tax=Ilyodon furcidens TaxID=33524 RepID=A0ABV0UF55_9TELE